MASTSSAVRQASAMSRFWARRTIALVLSPVGLLLVGVTRLLIVANYNTTTATTIASSGGYVNTLLGTVIPLVPIILPYLAVTLLLFRRFVLSALTFAASLLITPTRLALPTALSTLKEDWNRTVPLVFGYWLFSLCILVVLVVTADMLTRGRAFRPFSVMTIVVSLLCSAFLLPYVLYVYPFPRTPNYYAEFMRQPWLSAERITVKTSQYPIVGYVLTENPEWMTVLVDKYRTVQYVRASNVISRSVCEVNSNGSGLPHSPLIPLLHTKPARLPSCWKPSSPHAGAPASQQGVQWTTKDATTSSTGFRAVPGLGKLNVCASGQITATVSVELNGAPASFRIRLDQRQLMKPGTIRFVPVGANDSFSFTFTQALRLLDGLDRHALKLQWRSPYGVPTNLERGTIDFQYQNGSGNC
jgi:hypothetical protein